MDWPLVIFCVCFTPLTFQALFKRQTTLMPKPIVRAPQASPTWAIVNLTSTSSVGESFSASAIASPPRRKVLHPGSFRDFVSPSGLLILLLILMALALALFWYKSIQPINSDNIHHRSLARAIHALSVELDNAAARHASRESEQSEHIQSLEQRVKDMADSSFKAHQDSSAVIKLKEFVEDQRICIEQLEEQVKQLQLALGKSDNDSSNIFSLQMQLFANRDQVDASVLQQKELGASLAALKDLPHAIDDFRKQLLTKQHRIDSLEENHIVLNRLLNDQKEDWSLLRTLEFRITEQKAQIQNHTSVYKAQEKELATVLQYLSSISTLEELVSIQSSTLDENSKQLEGLKATQVGRVEYSLALAKVEKLISDHATLIESNTKVSKAQESKSVTYAQESKVVALEKKVSNQQGRVERYIGSVSELRNSSDSIIGDISALREQLKANGQELKIVAAGSDSNCMRINKIDEALNRLHADREKDNEESKQHVKSLKIALNRIDGYEDELTEHEDRMELIEGRLQKLELIAREAAAAEAIANRKIKSLPTRRLVVGAPACPLPPATGEEGSSLDPSSSLPEPIRPSFSEITPIASAPFGPETVTSDVSEQQLWNIDPNALSFLSTEASAAFATDPFGDMPGLPSCMPQDPTISSFDDITALLALATNPPDFSASEGTDLATASLAFSSAAAADYFTAHNDAAEANPIGLLSPVGDGSATESTTAFMNNSANGPSAGPATVPATIPTAETALRLAVTQAVAPTVASDVDFVVEPAAAPAVAPAMTSHVAPAVAPVVDPNVAPTVAPAVVPATAHHDSASFVTPASGPAMGLNTVSTTVPATDTGPDPTNP